MIGKIVGNTSPGSPDGALSVGSPPLSASVVAAPGKAAGNGSHPDDPWPAFRFMVKIDGIGILRFQKCQNIGVEAQPEDGVAGGRTGPGYMLPPLKWSWKRVQLVKGMAKDGGKLWKWVIDTVTKRPIEPHEITITLLDVEGKPRMQWIFHSAYPTSWTLQPLDASSAAALAVDTIEFSHQGVDVNLMGG
jgi:phage tail-like protein